MATSYENFRPTSQLIDGPGGVRLIRTVQIRATDEIACRHDSDTPQRGDQVNVAEGSGSEYVYCRTVAVNQTKAAGNAAGEFLFDVVANYEALQSGERKNPTLNKAAWSVDGQMDKIRVFAVDTDDDQFHYGQVSAPAGLTYDGTGINVNEDGAQGADVDDPYETLTIDFWKAPADTEAFLNTVRGLRNTTNNAQFSGPWGDYDTGAARLVRYLVRHVNGELDQISLSFLVGTNYGDASGGPAAITVTLADGTEVSVDKLAHQYFWKRMMKWADPLAPTSNQVKAVDAHVATVYFPGDFSLLGITDEMFV